MTRATRPPLAAASPPTRLLLGALMVGCILLVPLSRSMGWALASGAVLLTLALARPRPRFLARLILLALLFHLPLSLLLVAPGLLGDPGMLAGTPLGADEDPVSAALLRAAGLLARGAGVLLVSVPVIATLSPHEAHPAISRLPLPATVRLILLQIVHQTGLLADETRRVRAAIALRGSGRGFRLHRSVPAAWLLRITERAERVADAMEMRGYAAAGALRGPATPARADRPMLLVGASALVASILLRIAG